MIASWANRITTEQQTLQEAFHFTVLKEHDPGLYELARQTRRDVIADGALPGKIKLLIAMLCDALRDRHAAVLGLADAARA
jgi:hypothetical protein